MLVSKADGHRWIYYKARRFVSDVEKVQNRVSFNLKMNVGKRY